MPAAKSSAKPAKQTKSSKSASVPTSAQLDIIVSGPLLIVPSITEGNITGVEIFSPDNGHPIGAVFVPGVFFSDAELNDGQSERWPAQESFSLLDPHSYTVVLTQETSAFKKEPVHAKAVPDTNHKVSPDRRLSGDWEIAIAVKGQMSAWESHRLSKVTDDLYVGADAPTGGTIAAMHRFTYHGVTDAEFCGAARQPKEYLRANIAKGGSLIILGEVPYQPSLLHERKAIDALAKLAGIDLHLSATDPNPHKTRLMAHPGNCGHSIVLV